MVHIIFRNSDGPYFFVMIRKRREIVFVSDLFVFKIVCKLKKLIFTADKEKTTMKQTLFILLLMMPLFVVGQRGEWWNKQKDFGKYNQDVINYLLEESVDAYLAGKYSQAIRMGKKTIKLSNKFITKDDITPMYYANLSMFYFASGQLNKAERIGTHAVRLYGKYGEAYDPAYGICLHNLAECNYQRGNIDDALHYIAQSIKIFEHLKDLDNARDIDPDINYDYYASLQDQTFYYGDYGDFDEAIKVGENALEFFKKHFDERNVDYINLMLHVATYKLQLGVYNDAVRLLERVYSLAHNTEEAFQQYLQSILLLADCCYELGNYPAAIEYGLLMVAFEKLINGTQTNEYARYLSRLSVFYSSNNNESEAFKLQTEALEILSKQRGKKKLDNYAVALNNMSGYYYEDGDIDNAIIFGKKASKVYRKTDLVVNAEYGTLLQNLSVYYYESNQYSKCLRYAKRSLNTERRFVGDNHPQFIEALRNNALLTFLTGKHDKSIPFFSESYDKLRKYILTNFATLTYAERTNLWSKFSDFFGTSLPYVACKNPDDSLCTMAYNALLLSKGLTLNSEIEIHNLIENSNDTALQNSYRKIRADLAKLDFLCKKQPNKRKEDVYAFRNKISQNEVALVQKSKALGDYTRNLSLTFKDVQNNLSDNDLAIEFASFQTPQYHQYVALVLKKGMSSPEIVNLFRMEDFNAVYSKNYYTTSDLYNLIWKPLQPYLQGVENVYFSPTDKLHTIGIEYLPDNDGKVFSDKYNVFRLSSTRELAMPKNSNPNKKAATFGGIQYNIDSISNGNGVMYLVGTKKESDAVASLLSSAEYEVFAKSDTAATEESFKNLSGQGVKILHISTHGFYQSDGELADYLMSAAISKEDRSLDCSGLLFAGANAALDSVSRSAIPDGNDDGILTAKEISRLDFRGLDLVILSACQTGLGEITGEGVFGLQRGFKKAGAHTIIQSLWDVDDYATRLLMIQFFKSLTEGLSKREAFQTAINYVKSKNDDPKYWAAFVMVDGI